MGSILLSTAYLPPAEYFAVLKTASAAVIEKEENYLKQTYRNRCYILSSNGPHSLSVPVHTGSIHKTPLKDIRIDYSKRWQQVHIRAMTASYASSPFFMFYFESFEKNILRNYTFLLDLNMNLLQVILEMLIAQIKISYTQDFMPAEGSENDFRYRITPKIKSDYSIKKYHQVFPCQENFLSRLSIVDLIFNIGPQALDYL